MYVQKDVMEKDGILHLPVYMAMFYKEKWVDLLTKNRRLRPDGKNLKLRREPSMNRLAAWKYYRKKMY